jgi:DNA-directed RNA polymerase subunit RPC12/RpoP
MSTIRVKGSIVDSTPIICAECGDGEYVERLDDNGVYYVCTLCSHEMGLSDFVNDEDESMELVDGVLHVVRPS